VAGLKSYIRDRSDVDWYTFEVTRPGTIYTVTLVPPPGVDLDVLLLSPAITRTTEELETANAIAAIADLAPISDVVGVADIATLADVASAVEITAADVSVFGARPGDQTERVSHRVWSDAGPQRLLVLGYNGQYGAQQPYRLDVEVSTARSWAAPLLSLPDYRPPISPTVQTLFVTNWARINSAHGITASAEMSAALGSILDRTSVSGAVIDLSHMDTLSNSILISQVYTAWDADVANPYLATQVSLVIQDVIADAIYNSYPGTRYIVLIGDDKIVPFARMPDKTAVGHERAYVETSGAIAGSTAYAALDGGFYLTDDCYADPEPLIWPGGQLCVPDYPIGRLVETPAEIAAAIDAYASQDGYLPVADALVTGYGFLTDQAGIISDTWGAELTVSALISDTWTSAELQHAWITSSHALQSISAGFTHFRALPAQRSAGALLPQQIAGNGWSGAVVGFAQGGHSGFSAHDGDFDVGKAGDFAQAMAAEGAVWIGSTGFAMGADSGVAYSEDLVVRYAQELLESIATGGAGAGEALVQAKRSYIAEAAPSSLDAYDLKGLMQTTLYGLPHWSIVTSEASGLRRASELENRSGQASVIKSASASTVLAEREISLTLSLAHPPSGAPNERIDLSVVSLGDSLGLLGANDVTLRQESSFGRPQLPSLSFSAVYSQTWVPRGVVILGATQTADYLLDPIVTRVITDQVSDRTEPDYEFQRWFPTQLATVNRLGSHIADETNSGPLVLYPAQFETTNAGAGALRVLEQLRLRIYYQDSTIADDTQPPVIRWVDTNVSLDQVEVTLDVTDPNQGTGQHSGVMEVVVLYSMGDGLWKTDVPAVQSPDGKWHLAFGLPPGRHGFDLSFIVQAVDGAGNVVVSSNKGEAFSARTGALFLPLLRKNQE
jgi:hypothetical protein